MSLRYRFVLLAAAALIGFAAQAATTGSGTAATQTRQVAEFQAIDVRGAVELRVRQAARQSVSVEADDNLLPMIETVVEGTTLKVGPRRGANMRPRQPIVVTVDVVQLKSIDAAGSSKVHVDGLEAPSFALTMAGAGEFRLRGLACGDLRIGISGSGDVEAAGRATSVSIDIAGSGDVRASALQSDDVRVRIAGSGDAAVQAARSLDVSIAGSGDVTYSGEPARLKTSVAGSGHIGRR
jgi:hypothetical protein